MAKAIEDSAAAAVEALNPLVEKWRELKLGIHDAASAITEDFANKAGIVFKDEAHKQINLSESLKGGLSKLGKEGFATLANGIGATVKQWVLLGHTGPAVMRRMLAETLASLAEQATVEALYWTAYGFAMLASQQYQAAGDAFTAAAIFAAVAVGSALVGRAIARIIVAGMFEAVGTDVPGLGPATSGPARGHGRPGLADGRRRVWHDR